MPSPQHEGPLELIRRRAAFGVELLTDVARVQLPAHASVVLVDSDLSDAVPAQFLADAALVLRDTAGDPVAGIIVENQLRPSDRKRLTWPHYLVALRARIERPVYLLVLCPDDDTAAWAGAPISLGSGTVTPIALGPGRIPAISDPEQALATPELAVLSAFAHSGDRAVLAAVARLFAPDVPDHEMYDAITQMMLPKAARESLEAFMTALNYQWVYDSDVAHEIEDRGRAKGKAEGKAEGRAEGKAEAKAEGVVTVLTARGFAIDDATRATITGCSDTEQLNVWLTRAATAATLGEVFA